MEIPKNSIDGAIEEKEKLPPFGDLVLFTTTKYGTDEVSKIRQALAEKLLNNAVELGIRCVVVDGGSNPDFLQKIRALENVTVEVNESLGMGESRREALNKSLELAGPDDKFMWVEPEKDDLITKESLGAMIEGLRDDQTDIVVPRRIDTVSMPKLQAWIEARANKRATSIIKEKPTPEEVLDLWFGPKMFNHEGAKFFSEYKGTLDKWDAIIKPVIEAAQAGKRISSVGVQYTYDITQSESEKDDRNMKQKRLAQYTQILKELGDPFWNKEEKKN